MELKEYEKFLNLAQQRTNEYLSNNGIDETKGTAADQAFANKFNKALKFRGFEQCTPPSLEGTRRRNQWKKCPACVLTRWGYVGEASMYAWTHYLMLLVSTQLVINRYNTDSKPNKIASGLQPQLLEEETHVDLTMMMCFHSAFFNEHLAWLMKSDDIAQHPSFQSHQVAVRHYIIQSDLSMIKDAMFKSHPGFLHFRNAMALLDDNTQTTKKRNAMGFVDIAIASIHKHFSRWCNPLLLPAALMTEAPLARCVARTILDIPMQQQQGAHSMLPTALHFKSLVHKRWIDLVAFENFLRLQFDPTKVDKTGNTCRFSQDIARDLLQKGVNFRCATEPNIHTTPNQKWLWWRHLPLASQTQFVEAGVKEAKLVSTTGRTEEMRSSYSIVRSSMLHPMGKIAEMSSIERIIKTVEAIEEHVTTQTAIAASDEQHQPLLDMIRGHIHENHFKHERLDQKRKAIDDCADNNKKENKRQKTTGVDRTAEAIGLAPFSDVLAKKKGHMEAIRMELVAHGVEVSSMKTFTDYKNALKSHEAERVKATEKYKLADEGEQKKMLAMTKKAFEVASEATFKEDDG